MRCTPSDMRLGCLQEHDLAVQPNADAVPTTPDEYGLLTS
jgi:hypothetical protein